VKMCVCVGGGGGGVKLVIFNKPVAFSKFNLAYAGPSGRAV
jgi:hypothetical protein